MLRAIASGITFLSAAFGTAILLRMAKPTCVPRDSDNLVCFGATFKDLGAVDYLIIGVIGIIAMTVVWSVIGKIAARRG